MKLYHKVIALPSGWRARAILQDGLKPQLASAYKDLVPLPIRGEPVVWLTENCKLSDGIPCFEVDTENLEQNRLHHTAVVYEADRDLRWWVYQGAIPPQALKLIRGNNGKERH